MTDALAIVGFVAIVVGLALVWPPLALVVGGAILVASALVLAYVGPDTSSGPKRE